NTELSIVNTLTNVQRKLQSGLIRGRENKYIQSRVMDVFNREGFTSFIARDGRQLPLDFYSQVVTRTNLKLARTKGSVNRYKENDVRLFKVSGNSPTCSICAQFRGFVFSMDKGNPDFPYLDPNRIPFHPNCQCSVIPYVLKYKTSEELDKDIEKAKRFKEGKDHRSNAEKRAYDNQQKLNAIKNQEKKQYAKIKSVMKDYYKTINRLKS